MCSFNCFSKTTLSSKFKYNYDKVAGLQYFMNFLIKTLTFSVFILPQITYLELL